jgi:hypothetical protein
MAEIDADKNYANKQKAYLEFKGLANSRTVKFLAYLTSFSQTFASDWSSELVYGRADPIGNYQGTQRNINLAWDIPSTNLGDGKQNLGNINILMGLLYPEYATSETSVEAKEGEAAGEVVRVGGNALVISKPPLIRLRFGNLIRNQKGAGPPGLLGWISNVSWTPVLDMGMFTDSGNFYPKVISLAVDFTVQHEHTLGRSPTGDTPTSFPFGG